MISKLHSDLKPLKDEKYREFQLGIVSSKYPLIGIRLPDLRNLARDLLKKKEEPEFLDQYYEEVLLHGFYIAGKKCPFKEKIGLIEDFLPLIDNWAICDSFVSSLKDIKKNRETYYPYVKKYLKSDEEFIQRYALVVLLNHYLCDEYLDDLYTIIKKQKYKGYYSEMAGAWLLSFLFMNHFERTVDFIRNEKLNETVRKKGIRKALDSYRLSSDQKDLLRSLG
ncbi:MAG: DNA alkylation repair protein [Erysipelotrichaceae bacterium]|nr:DNA alkylation repair protein [Erysipelotrichaceae bacterium]MBQ6494152.1 DNA alkylation repair protein [Erysipelotrichaceae bacterium]